MDRSQVEPDSEIKMCSRARARRAGASQGALPALGV